MTLLGAWLPIILASGIVVVPSGMDGVRVSQTPGMRSIVSFQTKMVSFTKRFFVILN